MTNKQIASLFNELADLMELQGENPFKIRSYRSVYRKFRQLAEPLSEMSFPELQGLQGVGDAIANKVIELNENGEMSTLERYRSQTPEGVRDMLKLKGFGPKKIKLLWKELEVESLGELLHAATENRVKALKGFSDKSQADLVAAVQFRMKSKGQLLYPAAVEAAEAFENIWAEYQPTCLLERTGDLRRQCQIIRSLEFICIAETFDESQGLALMQNFTQEEMRCTGQNESGFDIVLHLATQSEFGSRLFETTGPDKFVAEFNVQTAAQEVDVLEKLDIRLGDPVVRDAPNAHQLVKEDDHLIKRSEIKGLLHNHSTYSDGVHSLKEMALAAREKGFEYFGITDHSQAAAYAGGLKPDRVKAQWEEIDHLNDELEGFTIFKGIEADILSDGRLDYSLEFLEGFDFVIASVHSNLKMNGELAMKRLLTAIEQPATTILGHMTGRLLLSRKGYEVDHKTIIDTCKEHQVAIELNANPHRLDMDWTWIEYAQSQGVKIAINPDAHSVSGIDDIDFGITAARKGGLLSTNCLNVLTSDEFRDYVKTC